MQLTPPTLAALARIIHQACGLVVGPEKAYLIRHRLEPILSAQGMESFEQLLQQVRRPDNTPLLAAVIEAITTQETQFFRDAALFDAIRDTILPERLAALQPTGSPRRPIRIWSAAASTGQEIYSLAILIRELAASGAARGVRESDFTLIASDISAAAIEIARAGRYAPGEVQRGLSRARLDRCFNPSGGQWQIDPSLRDLIQFRTFNLLDRPASLGFFDLVLCRNVLIYFDEPTRRRVTEQILGILHPGGWLALGAAESLRGMEDHCSSARVGTMALYRALQAG